MSFLSNIFRRIKDQESVYKSYFHNMNTNSQECLHCAGSFVDDSDGFFRSFDVSFPCKCGGNVIFDRKEVDRERGLIVEHYRCRTPIWIPPSVWCPKCKQNFDDRWKSILVFEHADEAANEYIQSLRNSDERQTDPLFQAPRDAQCIKAPLIDSCDNCGKVKWWTPDGRMLWRFDLEHHAPLRCYECGRWAVIKK